jgi:hypothetical protein
MLLINLLEDFGPINREPATAREVMEVALIGLAVSAIYSTIVLLVFKFLTGFIVD